MTEYIEIKGLWEKGEIHLLEKPNKTIDEKTEVKVLFPIHTYRGISVNEFLTMNLHCSIGGDSVEDTENLYNE